MQPRSHTCVESGIRISLRIVVAPFQFLAVALKGGVARETLHNLPIYMMTVTTRCIFKNCLLKLLYLFSLFIGGCQADQGKPVPIIITVAIIALVAASIIVTLICACLRTQCACCQSLGRQYHRISSTAEYPIIINPQGQYYQYGSNQLYPTQMNMESYTASNPGPPPAQIDHEEASISLSTTATPSTSPTGDDSPIVTHPSEHVILPEIKDANAVTSLETTPLASEPVSLSETILYDHKEEDAPPAIVCHTHHDKQQS